MLRQLWRTVVRARVAPGQPALDGVDGTDAPKVDQRGKPRPALYGFDIGAVERQPTDPSYPYLLMMPLLNR